MNNESGCTILEYALLVAMLAIVSLGGFVNLGLTLRDDFNELGRRFEEPTFRGGIGG